MGILTVQVLYSLTIVLLGNIITDYYDLATYKNPKTLYQKTITFIINIFFGLGPFVYGKLLKYSWLLRKLYMLVATFLMAIISIPLYYFIINVLDFILLKIFY